MNQSQATRVNAEQWLDEHGDYLFGYAMSRVHSTATAEDLVQETLLAAMKAQDSFAGRSAVRTWLVGILKHKIADALRRAKQETARGAGGAADSAEFADEEHLAQWADSQFTARGKWKTTPERWSRGSDPASTAERLELTRVLEECLHKLPARAAEIFLMTEQRESTVENVSKVHRVSATNIGVILYRARLALRRCLELNWFSDRGKKRSS